MWKMGLAILDNNGTPDRVQWMPLEYTTQQSALLDVGRAADSLFTIDQWIERRMINQGMSLMVVLTPLSTWKRWPAGQQKVPYRPRTTQ